jgi:hypothetical protein
LLRWSAHVDRDEAHRHAVAWLAEGELDWESLVRRARAEGLVPQLSRFLGESYGEAVPTTVRAALAAEAREIGYRNVYLAAKLVELLRRFTARGLPVVPYKGPALALAAYGSIAARQFGDLDLLVRRRDFDRARDLLLADGFRLFEDEWLAVRHLAHEVPFVKEERRVQVDLHRRVLSRELFPVAEDELWSQLEPIRIGELETRTFRAELLLILLCEHAHKHRWERRAWIADLAHLIAARPQFDWEAALDLARRAGSLRVLGVGALLAFELFGAPLPEPWRTRFDSDAATRVLAATIRERPYFETGQDAVALDRTLVALQWRGRERWRDRLRLALTPNESDWIVLPLPAALAPLYYLLRPLRVVAKYGVTRLRQLMRASRR